MAFTVFINVLIAFFFTITIRYLYQGGKITQLDWDMSTVTAGDYTVEFMIERENYDDWKDMHYKKAGGPFDSQISPALALKEFLSAQIEEILDRYLSEHPELYSEEAVEKQKKDKKKKKKKRRNDGSFTETKVADITFSFNNRELVLALRKRGACIAANDFDGMRKMDIEVQKLFMNFEDLTVPTSAFITFVSDDSKEFALQNESTEQLMYKDFRFKNASEPTDIIWENRNKTAGQILCRQAFACTIIIAILAVPFIIIFAISAYSAAIAQVFPLVDCVGIKSSYVDGTL